ncbi:type III secretion protein BopE [Burkholderia alba]|uniref:type III secretion protein BopE n=1 Tax=Burkholderia alba TaxID=2683677 RepID=UPI002B05C19D|nr:type III secretion protein BopE [Burkholderia alba]
MTYNPRIGGFTHTSKTSFGVHVKRCDAQPRTSFAQQVKRIFSRIGEALGRLFRCGASSDSSGRVKLKDVRYVGSVRPDGDRKQEIRHFLDASARQVADKMKNDIQRDPEFGRQVCEATLCAIYSEAKDRFCMDPATRAGDARSAYVAALGDAARTIGLPGSDRQGVFTPSGAGTNPVCTELWIEAYALMGAELAASPDCRALQGYARQQAVDIIAAAAPADRADALVRFQQAVRELDDAHRPAAGDASRASGAPDAA